MSFSPEFLFMRMKRSGEIIILKMIMISSITILGGSYCERKVKQKSAKKSDIFISTIICHDVYRMWK